MQDQNAAVDAVMKRADASTTNRDHQVSMMREVAKLVQPDGLAPDKIGFIDPAKFKTTADIALKFNVITKPAAERLHQRPDERGGQAERRQVNRET